VVFIPGIAHIAISLIFSAFLIKITHGLFNKKHGLIFTINSLIGPDLMSILFLYSNYWYYFTHGYGWFIPAFLVALPYWFFINFKIKLILKNNPKSWKILNLIRKDPDKNFLITYSEIYCLVAAGGIFHQAIDLIGHPSFINYEGNPNTPWGVVWFGNSNWFSIDSILGTGMFPCGNELGFFEFYIFISMIFIILILVFSKFLIKNNKKFIIGSIVFFIIYFTPLSIAYFIPDTSGFDINAPGVNYFGDPYYIPYVYRLTGGEADLGVMFYILLFYFVPMILIYFGYKGFPWTKKFGLRAKIEQIEKEYKNKIDNIY